MSAAKRTARGCPVSGGFVALVTGVLVVALAITLVARGMTTPIATLGISTAQAQQQLAAMGIQFTTRAVAGVPSIGGSSPDGNVNLVLTGTDTALMRAVIVVSLPTTPDGNHPVAAAGSATEHWMRAFFASVLPGWSEGTAWWRANATTTTSVRTSVAKATVVLTARQIPSTGGWDMQTCVVPNTAAAIACP